MNNIKFVGLHAHSVAGSPFDALAYPQEHMDYAYENGCNALALTDHGNCNGLVYQVLHAKKMQKEGKKFKPIFGVEAYFIDSIEKWLEKKKIFDQEKKNKKKKEDEERSGTVVEEDDGGIKKGFKNLLNKRSHLILLAQNQKGLNNIFKLVSESYKEGNFYRFPRIDYKLLSQYNEGIIASSACIGGILGRTLFEFEGEKEEVIFQNIKNTIENFIEIFGKERFLLEMQWNRIKEQHVLNKLLLRASKEYNLRIISTCDSHYPKPDSWKNRIIYKKLGFLGKSTKSNFSIENIPESVSEIGYELYPKNGNQMWESYKRYSKEAGFEYDDDKIRKSLEITYDIAHNEIEDFFPENSVKLPGFVVPKGKTPDIALTEMAIEGLRKKGLEKEKKYVEQLKHEIRVVQDRGFSKYFLAMKAISDKAQESQLVGVARGSAGGSLLAYVLEITQLDPIKWGLQFSRFLRSDAVDYPDIDMDYSEPMELKQQLIDDWGKNNVAPISNWNTLQLKSLIKDISKLYGIPWQETNEVTKQMYIEATPKAKAAKGITAGVYVPTFEETLEYSSSLWNYIEDYPFVGEHVAELLGQVRSCSRHAGGCLLSENLDFNMPLINSGGVRQSPWTEGQNVRHLEPMGFIKFDLLGLSSLRMIHSCIEHILKRHFNNPNPTFKDVKKYYNDFLHPEKIDFEDQNVYENIFHKGKWAGVFQFTGAGAQMFCQKVKPRNIDEISIVTSIYRPAALAANVDEIFLEAKENKEDISYAHPILKEVLETTYGNMIFQEQIASVAHLLGKNISLDEGNILRKLLTKKGIGEVQEKKDKIFHKFIEGCDEKKISRANANKIWQTMENFSGYGFNKSHATAYSMISFQCAFLLNYYPVEWMAAFLDREPENKKEKAINIARSLGFRIELIDINKSGKVWEIDSKNNRILIQPLTSIKGVGEVAVSQIIQNRPYKNIEEFIFEKNGFVGSKVDKRCLDALIKIGAFDDMIKGHSEFKHRKHLWHVTCDGDKPKTIKKFNKRIKEFINSEDFSEEEKIEYLVSLGGLFPIHMVVKELVSKRIEELYISPISQYDKDINNGIVWFVTREVLKKKTRQRNKDYYIVKVIDMNSVSTEIKIWGVNPNKDLIFINRPYMAKLDYDEKWGFSCRGIKRNFKLLG